MIKRPPLHRPPCLARAKALLFCVLSAPLALAGTGTYQCAVHQQIHLTDAGTLRPPPEPNLVGKRFTVDRRTGQITGPEGAMWSVFDSKYEVLGQGTSSNAFVVLATTPATGNGVSATLLSVHEFKAGGRKPFSVHSLNQIASGLCE